MAGISGKHLGPSARSRTTRRRGIQGRLKAICGGYSTVMRMERWAPPRCGSRSVAVNGEHPPVPGWWHRMACNARVQLLIFLQSQRRLQWSPAEFPGSKSKPIQRKFYNVGSRALGIRYWRQSAWAMGNQTIPEVMLSVLGRWDAIEGYRPCILQGRDKHRIGEARDQLSAVGETHVNINHINESQ